MERLTTNKDVSEMGMYELAHNSCYIKNGKTRYRDFERDIDTRDLARNLMKIFADEEIYIDDDNFDDEMLELLSNGTSTIEGLIASFYCNMWAMAELRERLKEYEDAEEQGRLVKLPCKVGDIVYEVNEMRNYVSEFVITSITIYLHSVQYNWKLVNGIYKNSVGFADFHIGKTVFLTKSEAEVKLAELRGMKNNEN